METKINAQSIINEVMAAHAIAPSEYTCGDFIMFKTSARGTHRVINDKAHLQRFADLVRKNAALFGGGLIKEAKTRPAVSYQSKTISLYKQLIEDKDYFAALQLADEKLSPLFFLDHKGNAHMVVAPVPLESEPRLVSAMYESGKFGVMEQRTMCSVRGESYIEKRSRNAQIENVLTRYNRLTEEQKDAVFERAANNPEYDQSAARAKWMADHGIVDDAAIEARIDAQAAQDVAEVVAQAVAVSAIAEAMAPAAEDEKELVTCEAGESEAQESSTGSASCFSVAAYNTVTAMLASFTPTPAPTVAVSSGTVTPTVAVSSEPHANIPQTESTEDAPHIIQKFPSDWPYASIGWSMVGGGRNAPGYASERSAKIDLSKNQEWKERNAQIVAFKWNDGGMRGCSPYWETKTRYAILVKKAPTFAEVAPIEDTSHVAVSRHQEIFAERDARAEKIGMDKTIEETRANLAGLVLSRNFGESIEDFFARNPYLADKNRAYLDWLNKQDAVPTVDTETTSPVVESTEATDSAPEPAPAVEIEATTPAAESQPEPVAAVVETESQPAATTPDDHAKFNIRAKSGAWFACVYMIGAMYGLKFEANGLDPITGEFSTHAERMAALEMMANALNTPPDGGQPIATVDAPTEAPTPPVAECTPATTPMESRVKITKGKISDIRRVIESCDWNRNDLQGATAAEFKAMDVPSRLLPHIEAVKSLEIPPRFAKDIERKEWAIECANKMIARWKSKQ